MYTISLLAYTLTFQSSTALWSRIFEWRKYKTGFEDLHAYLCSFGGVAWLKAPFPWAVIHLRGSWWTAPALCVIRVCTRLREGPFKSQSAREVLGKLWCCRAVIKSQEAASNTSHLGTRSRGLRAQVPGCHPSCLVSYMKTRFPFWRHGWWLPVCLSFTSKQHRKHRQLARDNGDSQSKEQTQQSRRPTMRKGKKGWPGSELMQKAEGVYKPNVWRRRETPGRKVQRLQLRRKGLASIQQLLAVSLCLCLFWLPAAQLWEEDRRQKQSILSFPEQVQPHMWPHLTFSSTTYG